tara:strand:- start:395 stop:745 length:351 start_codon:yes stop_codon:yes gene_type:complete
MIRISLNGGYQLDYNPLEKYEYTLSSINNKYNLTIKDVYKNYSIEDLKLKILKEKKIILGSLSTILSGSYIKSEIYNWLLVTLNYIEDNIKIGNISEFDENICYLILKYSNQVRNN